jgi:hypothetical protein
MLGFLIVGQAGLGGKKDENIHESERVSMVFKRNLSNVIRRLSEMPDAPTPALRR